MNLIDPRNGVKRQCYLGVNSWIFTWIWNNIISELIVTFVAINSPFVGPAVKIAR